MRATLSERPKSNGAVALIGRPRRGAAPERRCRPLPPAGHQAAGPEMTFCSSPDSYISIMMSEPPMNSPLT